MLNRVCYTILSRVSCDSFLAGGPHSKDVNMSICYYAYNSKRTCPYFFGTKAVPYHFLNVPEKRSRYSLPIAQLSVA